LAAQVVVYDIGNVLIGWQPEQAYDRMIGVSRREALFASVDLHAMNDRVDLGENFHNVLTQTIAAHPEFGTELEIWRDRWIDLTGPVIDHSLRLLRQLRAKGVLVLALSNFGVEAFEWAEARYPFLREFDQRFISGHLQLSKPDSAIYQALEAECGVAPDRLLFTDDRADNIAAARARGWQVHLFDGAAGWAQCLVDEGLLSEEEAA
jgi:2-haloacid dehalogenase